MSENQTEAPAAAPERLWRWTTESVLIAAVPFLGYVLAFTFEWGYASAYGIPINLVSVGLGNAIAVGGVTVCIVGVLCGTLHVFDTLVGPSNSPKLPIESPLKELPDWVDLVCFGISMALCVSLFVLLLASRIGHYTVGMIAAGLAAVESVWDRRNKLRAQRGIKPTKFASLWLRTGPSSWMFSTFRSMTYTFVLFFFGLGAIYEFGAQRAADRTSFLVPADRPDFALVAVYGEGSVYVLCQFDEDGKQWTNKMLILNNDDLAGQTLALKDVGKISRQSALDPETDRE